MTEAKSLVSLIGSSLSEKKSTENPSPYYPIVPKTMRENLEFRKKVIQLGSESKELQSQIWKACKRDLLFWINTFCWTYDPRLPGCTDVPFITYGFQDRALLEMLEIFGKEDMTIEKSRDMGATWMICIVPTWDWQFSESRNSYLLISRNEDYVDKTGDPKSLFWKIDYVLEHQPKWLLPAFVRRTMHLVNTDNFSTIDGESTTGNVGRGDRRKIIVMDEFAAFELEAGYRALKSTQSATRCRIFNSTPAGIANAFYDICQTEIKKVRMHWSEHPEKNDGLYKCVDGQVERLDRDFRWPRDYQFVDDGKLRSPWYDNECKRASHPSEIEQELDINYRSSDNPFFTSEDIERAIRRDSREPAIVGIFDYRIDTVMPEGIIPSDRGELSLWCSLTAEGTPPPDADYVCGVDIATGQDNSAGKSATSNSVIVVANKKTGTKVAEAATPKMMPHEWAQYCVALARWFNNATLIWESNGPGRIFGNTVKQIGYGKIFYRKYETKVTEKKQDEPGFWSDKQSKIQLLGDYRRALRRGFYTNRSERSLKECYQIIYFKNGTVGHAGQQSVLSPAAAGENHGDFVIADSLAWKVIQPGMVVYRPNAVDIAMGAAKYKEPIPVVNMRSGARQFAYRKKMANKRRGRYGTNQARTVA